MFDLPSGDAKYDSAPIYEISKEQIEQFLNYDHQLSRDIDSIIDVLSRPAQERDGATLITEYKWDDSQKKLVNA